MKSVKNIKKYILPAICFIVGMAGCNDGFLDREPTHDLNDVNYWKTANDLKVYVNGIYNDAAQQNYSSANRTGGNWFFVGNSDGFNSSYRSAVFMEACSDNLASLAASHNEFEKISAGINVVPDTPTAGGWYWHFLRRCNVFLANYERAEIAESLKNNYAGEVYFFRAWFYLDKVQNYGNVPLITTPLDIDSPELYEKQANRKDVMELVLQDINKAIDYLPQSWSADHPNRVNKWTALALKSRICLYEGTYRKYHGLGDHDKFLDEAINAASELMEKGPYRIFGTGNPASDYRTLFTSLDLTTNPEIIMPRVYAPGTSTATHRMSGYIRAYQFGATKDLVDDYLCLEKDGTAKPVALSSVFKDDRIEDVFDNRDPRLSQTILDPRQEEDIIVEQLDVHTPRLTGMASGSWLTITGYHFIKNFDHLDELKGFAEEIDYPVIRYAEVLLNYAEAKAEKGNISQTDLDKSINIIRDRVGMPHLDVNPPMDPKYAGEGLSSLLVEIRRERRIELAFENFRYQDLMRWKKGSYLTKQVLGMRLEDGDRLPGGRYEKTTVKTIEVNGKKYVDVFVGTDYAEEKRKFDENKDYLRPLPIDVIAKNPNLDQNPGWK
jgi:hypothetical protein